MFHRILTVCVGNICRSPTAECLLRESLPTPPFRVTSAGLGALVGKGIEASALTLIQQHGHTPHEHAARQITREMLLEADLVLTMERQHIEHIHTLCPESRGKVYLLGKWQNERDIADPYRRGEAAFNVAFQQIKEGVAAWVARIHR